MYPRTSPIVLSAVFEQLFDDAAIGFRQLPRQEIGRQFAGAAPDHAFSHELVDDLFDRAIRSDRRGIRCVFHPPSVPRPIQCAISSASSPTPLITSSAESPPSSRGCDQRRWGRGGAD